MNAPDVRLRYLPQLDGLRAVAALMVIALHARLPGFPGGSAGVEIFFVLSGYLITSLLLAEFHATGTLDIRHFWARRLVRLYPELLVTVAAFAAASLILRPEVPVALESVMALTYFSNYFLALTSGVATFTAHMWSLGTEMQFYIVWPIVVLALAQRGGRRAIEWMIGLFIAATLLRVALVWGAGTHYAYFAPETRLSGLIAGSCLAFVRPLISGHYANLCAALGFLLIGAFVAAFRTTEVAAETWAMLMLDVASVMAVASLASGHGVASRVLANPMLVHLGVWSYGIYLWHYPVSRLVSHRVDALQVGGTTLGCFLVFAFTAAISTALAAASYRFAAVPAKRWYRAHRMARVSQPAAA